MQSPKESMENLTGHTEPPSAGPSTTQPDTEAPPLTIEESYAPENEKAGDQSTSSFDSSSSRHGEGQLLTAKTAPVVSDLSFRSAGEQPLRLESTHSTDTIEDESQDEVFPLSSLAGSDLRLRRTLERTSSTKTPFEIMEAERRSNAIDLETGKQGGARSQFALIREDYEREPQSRRRRGIRKIVKFILHPFRKEKGSTPRREVKTRKEKYRDAAEQITRKTFTIPQGDDMQYQIFSIDESFGQGFRGISEERKKKFCGFKNRFCSFSVEKWVTMYLFSAFRVSFFAVLISAGVIFAWFTFGFAALLFIFAQQNPNCLTVDSKDFDGTFMDAYALSWTTFSTVGYGAVYPGTSKTAGDVDYCWAITIISTVESFVGIIFVAFWGAIFLSKVTRVSSSAQVAFSNGVLVRFGTGVMGTHNGDDSSSDDSGDLDLARLNNYPCPVLEFRLINKLSSQRKGEIIDATLNMVASVHSSQIPSRDRSNMRKKKKGKKGKGSKHVGAGIRIMTDEQEGTSDAEVFKAKQTIKRILIASKNLNRGQEDTNNPEVADKREFAKLFVESQDHPFFKRVWVARHILDQESPLLRNDVKELISLKGGRWPSELNNAAAVRACVNFDQILVSLSGTSNADANTVYAQKIYDYSAMVVGFRFANILYREIDGSLGVDANLLHDVLEQTGGGAENMDADELQYSFKKSKADIVIL